MDIFEKILDNATRSYKPVHALETAKKSDERFNETWEIIETKNYNSETNRIFNSKLSLYQPLYMELEINGEVNQLESKFIKELEKYESTIEWFWKNGKEHMESNFGIQKEDKTTFQPDFIIKFEDGRVGIFDTKAGKGRDEEDNRVKSNALYKYITEERFKGKNLIGGFVILDGETFKFYQHATYSTFESEPDKWEKFNNLFQ